MGGLAIAMATSITPAQYRITLGVVGFMTVLGTALLIFGDVFLKAAWASRTWPTATATVGAVNVVDDRASTSNTSRPYYSYAVTYGYEVAGQSYSASLWCLIFQAITVGPPLPSDLSGCPTLDKTVTGQSRD